MLPLDFAVHDIQPGWQRQQPGQLDVGGPITLGSKSLKSRRFGLLNLEEKDGRPQLSVGTDL